jgi:hypothetical protein
MVPYTGRQVSLPDSTLLAFYWISGVDPVGHTTMADADYMIQSLQTQVGESSLSASTRPAVDIYLFELL